MVDEVGVVAVRLDVDGVPVGDLTYLPDLGAHAAPWDARGASPGPHTLAVTAHDAAGNQATAEVIVVVPAGARSGEGSPEPGTPVP